MWRRTGLHLLNNALQQAKRWFCSFCCGMAGALAALMAIKPSDSHMQSGPILAHALPLEHRTSEPLYSLASYLHIKSIARLNFRKDRRTECTWSFCWSIHCNLGRRLSACNCRARLPWLLEAHLLIFSGSDLLQKVCHSLSLWALETQGGEETCGFSNRPMIDDASCTYAQQLISTCDPAGPDYACVSGCSAKAQKALVRQGVMMSLSVPGWLQD